MDGPIPSNGRPAQVIVKPAQAAPGSNEVDLEKLAVVFGPLVNKWFSANEEDSKRRHDLLKNEITYGYRIARSAIVLVGLLAVGLFGLCFYLFNSGKDAVAVDLLKMIALFGAGAAGGYGYGRKSRVADDDSE